MPDVRCPVLLKLDPALKRKPAARGRCGDQAEAHAITEGQLVALGSQDCAIQSYAPSRLSPGSVS